MRGFEAIDIAHTNQSVVLKETCHKTSLYSAKSVFEHFQRCMQMLYYVVYIRPGSDITST